jgi:hypothetical protein
MPFDRSSAPGRGDARVELAWGKQPPHLQLAAGQRPGPTADRQTSQQRVHCSEAMMW